MLNLDVNTPRWLKTRGCIRLTTLYKVHMYMYEQSVQSLHRGMLVNEHAETADVQSRTAWRTLWKVPRSCSGNWYVMMHVSSVIC